MREREREKKERRRPFDCVPHRVKARFEGNTLETTVIPVFVRSGKLRPIKISEVNSISLECLSFQHVGLKETG